MSSWSCGDPGRPRAVRGRYRGGPVDSGMNARSGPAQGEDVASWACPLPTPSCIPPPPPNLHLRASVSPLLPCFWKVLPTAAQSFWELRRGWFSGLLRSCPAPHPLPLSVYLRCKQDMRGCSQVAPPQACVYGVHAGRTSRVSSVCVSPWAHTCAGVCLACLWHVSCTPAHVCPWVCVCVCPQHTCVSYP